MYFIESKLAVTTRIDWAKEIERKNQEGFPSYEQLESFLEDRIRTLDLVESETTTIAATSASSSNKPSYQPNGKKHKTLKGTLSHVATNRRGAKSVFKPKCSYCGGEHFIGYCPQFSHCSQKQRREHVAKANLCSNCFSTNHEVKVYPSAGRCLVCGERHHTKLHSDRASSVNVANINQKCTAASTDASHPEALNCHTVCGEQRVLLSTACVLLEGPNGSRMTVRALLDSGAEESFVSEHVVQTLGLRKLPTDVAILGVGGSVSAVARGRVSLTLKSTYCAQFSLDFSALVLKRLTATLPKSEVRTTLSTELRGLQLADPFFGKPGRIDFILNSEVYAAVIQAGLKRGPAGTPIALQTVFGWVLMGSTTSDTIPRARSSLHHVCIDPELTRAVARFWECEEVPATSRPSPNEEICLKHFDETCTRDETGRFVVRIPFIRTPSLGDTRNIAVASFTRMERRFQKQPQLATAYTGFMDEYWPLDHMELVPENEVNCPSAVYITHHPVIKTDGSNKIRVVFVEFIYVHRT